MLMEADTKENLNRASFKAKVIKIINERRGSFL